MMFGCLELVEYWCGQVGCWWIVCGNVGLFKVVAGMDAVFFFALAGWMLLSTRVSSTLRAVLLRCSVGGEGA
eukprot:14385610-Ditylum_brightwellii.AAC.1